MRELGMAEGGLTEEHDGSLTMGHEVLMSVSLDYRRLYAVSPYDEAPLVVYALLTSYRDSDYREHHPLASDGLRDFALKVFLPATLAPAAAQLARELDG
jgi:hypothetical protein